jgi:hypothetical protein
MRIFGPTANAAVATAPAARRTGGQGFSVSDSEESRSGGTASALRTVGGIDALIALQGVEDPLERRRQGYRRGRTALDALDELKVGLLGGAMSPSVLARLKTAASSLRDSTGEAGLDTVLGEIELRVEVELAKVGTA